MHATALDRSLRVFFGDALRVAAGRPRQALTFARTLARQARSARRRARLRQQGIVVPPIVIFSVTDRCNLRCPGCYAHAFRPAGEAGELREAEIRRILREATDLGVSFFVLAGGEPFLRPDIIDAVRPHAGIIFLVFTNGLVLDDRLLRRVKAARNLVPLVSLDGPETETDARRGPGTYRRVAAVMEAMRALGVFFGASLTLTSRNFESTTAAPFVEGLLRAGCRFLLFLSYTAVVPGPEALVLSPGQRSRVPALMRDLRSRYRALFIAVPWDEDDAGGCLSAGRGFVHINAGGDLEPCPFAPVSDANVRKTPLRQALASPLLARIRSHPDLGREDGGGCVLRSHRGLVESLLAARTPEP